MFATRSMKWFFFRHKERATICHHVLLLVYDLVAVTPSAFVHGIPAPVSTLIPTIFNILPEILHGWSSWSHQWNTWRKNIHLRWLIHQYFLSLLWSALLYYLHFCLCIFPLLEVWNGLPEAYKLPVYQNNQNIAPSGTFSNSSSRNASWKYW